MDEYLDKLKKAHDECYGKENFYIDNNFTKFNQLEGKLKYIKTERISVEPRPNYKNYVHLNYTTDKRHFIKNVKTNIPDEYIDCYTLEIGGLRIDRIFNNIFKELRVLYNLDNNKIPIYLLQYNYLLVNEYEIRLFYETNDLCDSKEYFIDFDIYESSEDIEEYEELITQLQFTGDEYEMCGKIVNTKFRLGFYHPVYCLIIKFNKMNIQEKLMDFALLINDKSIFESKEAKYYFYNDCLVIPLYNYELYNTIIPKNLEHLNKTSINLGQEYVVLFFKFKDIDDEDNRFSIYAVGSQILFYNKIVGLR